MEPCAVVTGLAFAFMMAGLGAAGVGLGAWIASEVRHRQVRRLAAKAIAGQDAFWADFDVQLRKRLPAHDAGPRGRDGEAG